MAGRGLDVVALPDGGDDGSDGGQQWEVCAVGDELAFERWKGDQYGHDVVAWPGSVARVRSRILFERRPAPLAQAAPPA